MNNLGTTTSNFQYRIDSNIPEKIGKLKENLLDFSVQFESGAFTKTQLGYISRELEEMAKYFGVMQGLSGSKLLSSEYLKAEPQENGIYFHNSAVDDYGRYYAGFVEYGHSTKKGTVVPARPFMRPALYTVSRASVDSLSGALGALMFNVFSNSGNGYQGVSSLNFGDKIKSNTSVVDNFQMKINNYASFKGKSVSEIGVFSNKKWSFARADFHSEGKKAFKKLNKNAIYPKKSKRKQQKKSSGVKRRVYGQNIKKSSKKKKKSSKNVPKIHRKTYGGNKKKKKNSSKKRNNTSTKKTYSSYSKKKGIARRTYGL